MIRVAFTLIGGKKWTGGYNYLLNLVRALSDYTSSRVQPVLFLGTDIDEKDMAPFDHIAGVVVIRKAVFNEACKGKRLRQALLTGCDQAAATAFFAQGIDVVFESAQFYGWRFPVPALAWIPDFQHRHLKHLFDFKARWKREIGFRSQILSGRHVLLSSDDARQDCERFYPRTIGRTHVVRFAVPPARAINAVAARVVADGYGLPETFFFLPNQFWKHKNHALVVEALALLQQRGVSVVVAASGKQDDPRDPAHFPRLQSLVERLGVGDDMRFLGLIPYPHLTALLRASTALLNPSLFEGWSTTVEEARALGTPMLLSDLDVHREQMGDQATYFDPHSSQSLADVLQYFQPLKEARRKQLACDARRDAELRVRGFGEDFARLAESCAQGWCW